MLAQRTVTGGEGEAADAVSLLTERPR